MAEVEKAILDSPFGRVELEVRAGRLVRVHLCTGRDGRARASKLRSRGPAARFVRLLERYFGGEDISVEPRALDLSGLTPFQERVLRELITIRFGQVVTYGELAARVGSPRGARAVGGAVGSNPLPIFVPCHRVIASGGELGGFGAGPEWKRKLLTHEGWTIEEGRIVAKSPDDRKPKTCVYAGSFDPPTNGHMFMIERGADLFDRLIVSVGINPNKSCTFSVEERLEMLRRCTDGFGNVEVDSFEGQFLVHYAQSKGAGYVLRGIRSEEDYRFEHAMRNVNEDMEPDITTVLLMPPREICEVSSSFVKGLVGFDGWQDVVKPYVPAPVYEKLLVSDVRWSEQSAGAEGGAD